MGRGRVLALLSASVLPGVLPCLPFTLVTIWEDSSCLVVLTLPSEAPLGGENCLRSPENSAIHSGLSWRLDQAVRGPHPAAAAPMLACQTGSHPSPVSTQRVEAGPALKLSLHLLSSPYHILQVRG